MKMNVLPALNRLDTMILAASLIAMVGCSTAPVSQQPAQFHFVYTSDAHYGITRDSFRGGKNVDAQIVNAALVQSINALPGTVLPKDGGISAGESVSTVAFIAETGDIANRQENGAQSAAKSWSQFESDYINNIALKDASGKRAPLFLVPGNHDVTNALGFYRPMIPATDATSMAQMYNRMMNPATPRTAASYNYTTDKVFYSKDIGGVHFVFINMWPDSSARSWLETDLKTVSAATPVVLFTHDQPDVESKHFINPNGKKDINDKDKFENLLSDELTNVDKDGKKSVKASTDIEQRALVSFLKQHKNVVAYFHGNANWNEHYVWKGPDKDIALNTFRVDSPMKGETTAKDESKLSYQVVSIDTAAKKMTVRERLWNAATPWGESVTVSLTPRAN